MLNYESSDLRSSDTVPSGTVSNLPSTRLEEVVLEIGNTWVQIPSCPSAILSQIDQDLRYPTEHAQNLAEGFRPPAEEAFSGWDGWIRFLRRRKNGPSNFPTGLLSRVEALAHTQGWVLSKTDLRRRPSDDIPPVGPISLRDYQKAAAAEAVKVGRGVLDIPPRGGKTRTMCEIHRQIALPTIWIAPTDNIVQRTLEGFFGKHYAVHQVGSKNLDVPGKHVSRR